MKILSRHSDTARAFAYLLKQWDALNVYCSNGRMEIDNNIAENALQGVAVGRKSWLFAGSDSGGEHVTVLYSLIGTCRLNNVEPEKWLRYVIKRILESRSDLSINTNTVHMSRLRISEPFFFCFLRAFFCHPSFPGLPVNKVKINNKDVRSIRKLLRQIICHTRLPLTG